MRLPTILLSVTSLFAARASAQDELGLGKMWTFENPPLAYLEKDYEQSRALLVELGMAK